MAENCKYKIGDIIVPKYSRHKNIWPSRRILDCVLDKGYLWEYTSLQSGPDNVFSSENSCDPFFLYYWEISCNL